MLQPAATPGTLRGKDRRACAAAAVVVSVNISGGGIPKKPLLIGEVTPAGISGDKHNHEKHNSPLFAISLLDVEDLEDFKREGFAVYPGAMGENLTVRGLSVDELQPGDRLRFSGGLEIEITKKRKPCYVLDSIDPALKKAVVGRCGCLAKVLSAAPIRADETIEVVAPAGPRGIERQSR
jgi:MOSC domain-containing protein YiiM